MLISRVNFSDLFQMGSMGMISIGGDVVNDRELLRRITMDPGTLAGKPVIRGTRLSVEYILNLLAHGETTEDIITEYQGLSKEDILACLLFATKSMESTEFGPTVLESV
jgi:uncharacterized protein (DUF433 family)